MLITITRQQDKKAGRENTKCNQRLHLKNQNLMVK